MYTYHVTTNGKPAIAGLVTDGHHGHYVNKSVIEVALAFGWQDKQAVEVVEQYDDNYYRNDWAFADSLFDIVSDAENWLNLHTPDGVWGWQDGDFRVDALTTCPECGEQRYADPDLDQDGCPDHME